MRSLLFDCLMTVARLIRHIHYKIANETSRFQDTSKAAELKYKQLEEYKDLLNRLVLYLDLLKQGGASTLGESDKLQRIIEVSNECKRIQIEIA